MISDLEKAKEEQERKRELWREQQKARVGAPLPGRPMAAKAPEPGEVAPGAELPAGRSPRAITARLRAEQTKAAKEKAALAEAVPGGEVLARAEELKKTVERLKNIYRLVNGAAGVTVVGLILVFLVMNTQLIFGNWLKASRYIPKLELPEIIIIGLLDVLVLAILFIIFVAIYAMIYPFRFGWILFSPFKFTE